MLKKISPPPRNSDAFVSCGKYRLDSSRKTYLMGVLNRTPDSFSDGGKFLKEDDALRHIGEMTRHGADIIDIGGESTRPGAREVSLREELDRVVPVIQKASKMSAIPISIDTRKAAVAEEALRSGAVMVNDVSGLKGDARMASVVKQYNAAVILMHSKGSPQTMQENPVYEDVVGEIIHSLRESMQIAFNHGIARENIVIDPGIGFGKTVAHNLEILRRLDEFSALRRPLLVGTSRKSFIGKVLNRDVRGRLWGTIATSVIAIMKGAGIVRAHDVRQMRDVITMADAVEKDDQWMH